jgi:LPXTG-motif cell wall-anchored protein
VPNDPEIRFMETAANAPPAIQTWWYPGTKTGHEFIYPRRQAEPLAQLNPGVLTTETEPRTGALERLAQTGETKPVEPLPATTTLGTKTVVGEPAPVPTPAIQPVEPSQAQAVTPTPRRHLPKTAGNLPAALIVGILSLAVGGTMVFWRRRAVL